MIYSYQIQEISNDPGGLHYRFAFKELLPIGYFLILLQSLAVISRKVRILAGNTPNDARFFLASRKIMIVLAMFLVCLLMLALGFPVAWNPL